MEMNADVYYDDLGKDMRVEEIPEDMKSSHRSTGQSLLRPSQTLTTKSWRCTLRGEDIPADKIRAAIRKATIAVEMVPVVCGTSYRNKGVQKLLDAIVDYMPAPDDVPPIEGVNPKTDEEETRPSTDEAPFAALAFKIMTDPFVGGTVCLS